MNLINNRYHEKNREGHITSQATRWAELIKIFISIICSGKDEIVKNR